MVEKKIGRYRVFGSNGHYVIGRWDGDEYRVMHGVPSYSTMNGAVRKAMALDKKDILNERIKLNHPHGIGL